MATNTSTSGTGTLEELELGADHILGAEYEHTPVPYSGRLSLFSNVMVWIGFPMIITGAMTGSILVLGMGFKNALTAMIVGNIIMFGYVGLLGLIGTRTGKNFALIATGVLGSREFVFPSGLRPPLFSGGSPLQTGTPEH